MHRWSTAGVLVATTAAAFAAAVLALKRVAPSDFESGLPTRLGRLNGVDVYVHLGDVAVPNRLLPVAGEAGSVRLDPGLRFWDAYLITAPVPEVVSTPRGLTLQVPWTLLPGSVTRTIGQIDPQFAGQVTQWLQLKTSPAEWHFDRLTAQEVPGESRYYLATGIRTIYAVNLFEFVRDLGGAYAENLTSAISSATKQVVEESGRRGNQKLGFPALAAAKHVIDRYLVVSYAQSFEAILDGVGRTRGNTPSEVVLVVWRAWSGTPELLSALGGLTRASYRKVPEWAQRLRAAVTAVVALSLLIGAVYAYFTTSKTRRSPRVKFFLGMIGLIPVVASYWYVRAVTTIMPVSAFPALEVSVLGFLGSSTGILLQRTGALAFGNREPSAAPGSTAAARAELLRLCDRALTCVDALIAFAVRAPANNYYHSSPLRKAMEALIQNRADVERLSPKVVDQYFAVKDGWEHVAIPRMLRQGDAERVGRWREFRGALDSLRQLVKETSNGGS